MQWHIMDGFKKGDAVKIPSGKFGILRHTEGTLANKMYGWWYVDGRPFSESCCMYFPAGQLELAPKPKYEHADDVFVDDVWCPLVKIEPGLGGWWYIVKRFPNSAPWRFPEDQIKYAVWLT